MNLKPQPWEFCILDCLADFTLFLAPVELKSKIPALPPHPTQPPTAPPTPPHRSYLKYCMQWAVRPRNTSLEAFEKIVMWDIKHKDHSSKPWPCWRQIPGLAFKIFKANGKGNLMLHQITGPYKLFERLNKFPQLVAFTDMLFFENKNYLGQSLPFFVYTVCRSSSS